MKKKVLNESSIEYILSKAKEQRLKDAPIHKTLSHDILTFKDITEQEILELARLFNVEDADIDFLISLSADVDVLLFVIMEKPSTSSDEFIVTGDVSFLGYPLNASAGDGEVFFWSDGVQNHSDLYMQNLAHEDLDAYQYIIRTFMDNFTFVNDDNLNLGDINSELHIPIQVVIDSIHLAANNRRAQFDDDMYAKSLSWELKDQDSIYDSKISELLEYDAVDSILKNNIITTKTWSSICSALNCSKEDIFEDNDKGFELYDKLSSAIISAAATTNVDMLLEELHKITQEAVKNCFTDEQKKHIEIDDQYFKIINCSKDFIFKLYLNYLKWKVDFDYIYTALQMNIDDVISEFIIQWFEVKKVIDENNLFNEQYFNDLLAEYI